jgi:hypothetical protein
MKKQIVLRLIALAGLSIMLCLFAITRARADSPAFGALRHHYILSPSRQVALDLQAISSPEIVQVDAVDSGWYSASGTHNSTVSNYLAGECAAPQCPQPVVFRNFFVFDLTAISGSILTATLDVENPSTGYLSGDSSETWTAFDVTTPIPSLIAGGSGLTTTYADLGSGVSYGGAVVLPSTTLVQVNLNDAALTALNASSRSQFALGGALTTLDAEVNREWVFGNSGAANVRRLILSVATPALAINYSAGQPGSYFTLTGSGFPPNGTATILVNDVTLTNTLAVDHTGGFAFLLSTSQADAGHYFVTTTVNPGAITTFILDPALPLRPQEGSGPIFNVPSGIAWKPLYLPLIVQWVFHCAQQPLPCT